MATTFQRARSDEQRALRSQAILDTAAAMLQEMPVADISLNELSRRVGLAKSNVLRYFDSREAVLLELLARSLARMARAAERRAARGRPAPGGVQAPRRAAGRRDRDVARRAPGAVRPHERAGRGARAQRVRRGGHPVQARGPRRRRGPHGTRARRAARARRGRRLALRHRRLADDLGAVGIRPPARGRRAGPRRRRAPREGRTSTSRDALEDYLTTLAIGLHARAAG